MTHLCDNRKCTNTATREVSAEGFVLVKRICNATECGFWVRAWFDVMHPVRGGHSLNVTPIESRVAT